MRAASTTLRPKKSSRSRIASPVWSPIRTRTGSSGTASLAREAVLDRDRAAHRGARAREREHEAVALRLHLEAAVLAHLGADHGVVRPQHLEPAPVAEPLVHLGGALDVAEQDRDRAVGRARAAQVGTLVLHRLGHGVDRGSDVRRVDPLKLEPERERALHERRHPDLARGVEHLRPRARPRGARPARRRGGRASARARAAHGRGTAAWRAARASRSRPRSGARRRPSARAPWRGSRGSATPIRNSPSRRPPPPRGRRTGAGGRTAWRSRRGRRATPRAPTRASRPRASSRHAGAPRSRPSRGTRTRARASSIRPSSM